MLESSITVQHAYSSKRGRQRGRFTTDHEKKNIFYTYQGFLKAFRKGSLLDVSLP